MRLIAITIHLVELGPGLATTLTGAGAAVPPPSVQDRCQLPGDAARACCHVVPAVAQGHEPAVDEVGIIAAHVTEASVLMVGAAIEFDDEAVFGNQAIDPRASQPHLTLAFGQPVIPDDVADVAAFKRAFDARQCHAHVEDQLTVPLPRTRPGRVQ